MKVANLIAVAVVLLVSVGAGRAVRAQAAPAPDSVSPRLAAWPLATREDELNAAFTPDGRTLYFTRKLGSRFGVILVSRLRGRRWTEPEVASFSGQYADYDPFVAADGHRIFWISNRPVDGTSRTDFDIWMAEWEKDGWGPAVHLPSPVNSPASEYYPTVTADGTLYFSSAREGGHGRGDIYRSRLTAGGYGAPENLGDSVNTAAFEGDPYISPDGSYLLFAAYGRPDGDSNGDLFLAHNRAGVWTAPRPLPPGINSAQQEYTPIVSPDGQWLYFTSYRGEIDQPRKAPLTTPELRRLEEGPLNGTGNLYRVPIGPLLQAPKPTAGE